MKQQESTLFISFLVLISFCQGHAAIEVQQFWTEPIITWLVIVLPTGEHDFNRFAPKSIRPQSFRPQVDSPQVVSPPSHYMSICICKNTPKLIEYPKKLFSKIYELQTNKLAHICEYCGQMDQTATAQLAASVTIIFIEPNCLNSYIGTTHL